MIFSMGVILPLTGCGAVQKVGNATVDVTKSVFVWDVKTLHVDFTARSELNLDDDFHPTSVVLRIYQLKNDMSFKAATYQSLADNDVEILGDSLLATKEVILKPSSSLSLDVPLEDDTKFVGMIALYKDPDLTQDNWRLLLKRKDLNIMKAKQIEVSQYKLILLED
jgi:type VI secretion system protein VasD